MKILYCSWCGVKVAEIEKGKLKKNMVGLCQSCEFKRIASDLARKTDKDNFVNPFSDIFSKLSS